MALKDITGNFAASGSNQEYKFQPAASTFGLQLVFGGIVSEFGR